MTTPKPQYTDPYLSWHSFLIGTLLTGLISLALYVHFNIPLQTRSIVHEELDKVFQRQYAPPVPAPHL